MMDEYIKREDALKAVTYMGLDEPSFILSLTLNVAQKNIRKIPAADVVEVVRCKDCIHCERGICYYPNVRYVSHDKNHFCSYGEKKGGAE